MGVDFPDFQQTSITNLVLQEIAELTIRPKYGGARDLKDDKSCDSGKWTELFTISSKGMIYGGWVNQYFTGNDGYSSVKLTIDELEFANYTFAIGRDLGSPSAFIYPIYCVMWDSTTNEYEVCFSYGITFETSLKVEVYNLGDTGDFSYEFHYALV